MDKKCKVCGVTGQDAEFYSGVNSRCKECHKKKVRENRAAKPDYYRAYDAKRFQDDPRVRERHERYRRTDAGRASMRKAREKWKDGNEEKRAAHVLLGNAVKRRRVEKSKSCELCGSAGRIEGHHEDYTQPLNVVWVCRFCHSKIHRGEIVLSCGEDGKFRPE